MNIYHCKVSCAVALGLLLSSSQLLADEQTAPKSSISKTTMEYLSDPARTGSLVGSIIAGSAVANPLAPLLGSVAGFMIGKSSAFSKRKGDSARSAAFANRSLMPDDSAEISSLAGLTGNSAPTSLVIGNSGLSKELETAIKPDSTITIVAQSEQFEDPEQLHQYPPAVPLGPTGPTGPVQSLIPVPLPDLAKALPGKSLAPAELYPENQAVPLSTQQQIEMLGNLQRQLARSCENVNEAAPVSLNCYYLSR